MRIIAPFTAAVAGTALVALAVTFNPGTPIPPDTYPLTVSVGDSVTAREDHADRAWYAHAEAVEALEREAESQVGR